MVVCFPFSEAGEADCFSRKGGKKSPTAVLFLQLCFGVKNSYLFSLGISVLCPYSFRCISLCMSVLSDLNKSDLTVDFHQFSRILTNDNMQHVYCYLIKTQKE